MNITLILLLFVISIVLLAIEFFLIPGTSLTGICAGICLVVAHCAVFGQYGLVIGLWVLSATILLGALFGYWIIRTKTIDKYFLHKSIEGTAATKAQLSVKVGDKGIAVTRLALIGNAEIGGNIVEVKSIDGFLDEGTKIVVVRTDDAQILIKKSEQ